MTPWGVSYLPFERLGYRTYNRNYDRTGRISVADRRFFSLWVIECLEASLVRLEEACRRYLD